MSNVRPLMPRIHAAVHASLMAAAVPCFARRRSHAHCLRSKECGRFGNRSPLFGRSLANAWRLSRATRPSAVGEPETKLNPVGSTVIQECSRQEEVTRTRKAGRPSTNTCEGRRRRPVLRRSASQEQRLERGYAGEYSKAVPALKQARMQTTKVVPSVGPAEYRSAGLQGGCRHRLRPCRRRCRAWPRSNARAVQSASSLTLPSNGHTTAGHNVLLRQEWCRRCVPLMSNVRRRP